MSELIVHQLPGAWDLPSVSPFCLKLDAYLRIACVPFRTVVDATPFKGPKRKLPWIEHEGRRIGDSGFAIEYLESRLGCSPDGGLAPAERAVALAMRRMIEESLYWALLYDRWMVPEHWRGFRKIVLGGLPAPARVFVEPIARRGVRAQIDGCGMGRHGREEIYAIGRGDIRAISDILGDKPFLMGDVPTSIDAVAYGFLANIVKVPIESPLKRECAVHANLVDYVKRFAQRYFAAA